MVNLEDSVFFLELFSGNGSISSVIRGTMGLRTVTIDMDETQNPDICMDLTSWDDKTAELVRKKAGGRRAIIWASPPCTEYSRMRNLTNQERNLELADRCVAVVEHIAADLDALVLLVENPATGMLKNREVIRFMPYRHEVHYCQYGFDWQKPTFIWSSVKLTSFKPKTCPGFPACKATCKPNPVVDSVRHIGDLCHAPYFQRIAVPNQLVNMIMRAVVQELPDLLPELGLREERARESYEVNYISKGRVLEKQLFLKVHWVGYDKPTWISSQDLEGDLDAYDFRSATLKQQILEAHMKVQQLSRNTRQRTSSE